MGLLSNLLFGRTATLTTDAAPVQDAEHPVGGYHPFWNSLTGLGSDRDPQTNEDARWYFQPLFRPQIETMVRMDGLASRICAMSATWLTLQGARSWSITDGSRAPQPWAARGMALNLPSRFGLAQTSANWQGDAIIHMLIEEQGAYRPDRQHLPVDPSVVTGIRSLTIYHKHELVRPTVQCEDGESVEYGDPLLWHVQSYRGAKARRLTIHASRVLHFVGSPIPPDTYMTGTGGWGNDSLLQCGMATLNSIASGRRGRQRLLDRWATWWAKTRFPKAGSAAEFLTNLQKRWAALRAHSSLGISLLAAGDGTDPGEDIIQINAPMAGAADVDVANLRDLSLTYGWPPEAFGTGPLVGSIGQGPTWRALMAASMAGYFTQRWEPLLRTVYDLLYMAQTTTGRVPDYLIHLAPIDTPTAQQEADARLKTVQRWTALIDAGALSPATVARTLAHGWQDELQPAIEGEDLPAPQPTTDAATGTLIALAVEPSSVTDLQRRAAQIVPGLRLETWPHVTLLYLGDVPQRSMPAIEEGAFSTREDWASEIEGDEVGTLGDAGAIVLFLRRRGLDAKQGRLLRSLAPQVRAQQFPRFLPHVTLGYAGALTDAQRTALEGLSVGSVRVEALVVRSGEVEVARWMVTS